MIPIPSADDANGKVRIFGAQFLRMNRCVVGLLFALALMPAACSGSASAPSPSAAKTAQAQGTRAAAATGAAAATATRVAAPVWVDVTATVQGSAAQHNVRLQVMVTVTNRTTAAIHLAGSCPHPAIQLVITNSVSGYSYADNYGVFCADESLSDRNPPIAAGASYTETDRRDLFPIVPDAMTTLRPGTYTVVAMIRLWHQGSLSQLDPSVQQPPIYGSVSGQATVQVP